MFWWCIQPSNSAKAYSVVAELNIYRNYVFRLSVGSDQWLDASLESLDFRLGLCTHPFLDENFQSTGKAT